MFTVEADVRTERAFLPVGSEALLKVARTLLHGRAEGESARQPGPWDALVRVAVERVRFLALVEGRLRVEDDLNPQPLPPRLAFAVALVQTVTNRAELLQEIADSVTRNGEAAGIIIVGGLPSRFADEFCGTNFHLVWPGPGPKPHWFPGTLSGTDLLVMGSQFEQTARGTFGTGLRQSFADAAGQFVRAAVAKL